MLYRYPASVAFYLMTKSKSVDILEVEKELNVVLEKGLVKRQYYHNLMSLALYIVGIGMVDPAFVPTWEFFQQRIYRMGLPQIRRDVNILISKLLEHEDRPRKSISDCLKHHYVQFMTGMKLPALVQLGKEDLKPEDSNRNEI
jgi:hypothetical protein